MGVPCLDEGSTPSISTKIHFNSLNFSEFYFFKEFYSPFYSPFLLNI